MYKRYRHDHAPLTGGRPRKVPSERRTRASPSGKRRRLPFALAACVFALLVCAAGAWLFFDRSEAPWYDTSATEGSYQGKTEEQIREELERRVAEGMMNISIASDIRVAAGSSEGEARIENIAANHVDQKVTITLAETGETVYQSEAIAPGTHIQTIPIGVDLGPGTHEALATFVGYDRETHQELGSSAAEITLTVES